MIACFDVDYRDKVAKVAAISCENWSDEYPTDEFKLSTDVVDDYQPGKFYRRELAPLLEIIKLIPKEIKYYVIDAYCYLSVEFTPGLGKYLHDCLTSESIVIGVAKNRFQSTDHAYELYRGSSKRPLFITSVGIEHHTAAQYIESMAGDSRLPGMLKHVDQIARG